MPPFLATGRSIWMHEFAVQGEKSIEDVAATCIQYADTRIVLVKAMDAYYWMGDYDIDPRTGVSYLNAPKNLAQWQDMVARGGAAGVSVIPWVVPSHPDQAPTHAALAVAGRLVIDAEPYAQFWQDTARNFAAYIQALQQNGVSELYVSTDPRRSAENALDESLWAPGVAGLLPQMYWTDFQQPYSVTIPMLDPLLALNSTVIPVLPFNGQNDFAAFYAAAIQRGCVAPSLWRLGSANGTQLQAFGQLQPVAAPVPPGDPCADLRQQVTDLTTQNQGLQGKLDGIAAILQSS